MAAPGMNTRRWPVPEFDRDIHNEIHFAERDEARSARAGLTEMQRFQSCTHRRRNGRVCPDCGDQIYWDET